MSEDSSQIEQIKSEIYQIKQDIEEIKLNLKHKNSRKIGMQYEDNGDSLYEQKLANYLANSFSKNISKSFTNFDWD